MDRLVRGDPHERDLQLQGRVGEHAQKLQLRVLLDRHQVEDADLKRTDILVGSPKLIHQKEVLVLENLLDRQIVLNLDRHFHASFPSMARKSSSEMMGIFSSFAFLFFPDVEVRSLLMRYAVFFETEPETFPP